MEFLKLIQYFKFQNGCFFAIYFLHSFVIMGKLLAHLVQNQQKSVHVIPRQDKAISNQYWAILQSIPIIR